MIKGFSGSTQILSANGTFKNITSLKPGDSVLNMDGMPVNVTNINRSSSKVTNELYNKQWHTALLCTRNLEVLINAQIWISAGDLSKNRLSPIQYSNALPEKFDLKINNQITLTPTYELGLFLGLFAGYGTITTNEVEFTFGLNNELTDRVSSILTDIFHANAFIENDDYCYKIRSKSDHIIDILREFNSKIDRVIPYKYWCSDKDYVRGLFDGLIDCDSDSKIYRYIAFNKNMIEIFLWICSVLDCGVAISHVNSGTLDIYTATIDEDDSFSQCTVADYDKDVDVWSVTVDCPTNSIVANNMIVRC